MAHAPHKHEVLAANLWLLSVGQFIELVVDMMKHGRVGLDYCGYVCNMLLSLHDLSAIHNMYAFIEIITSFRHVYI